MHLWGKKKLPQELERREKAKKRAKHQASLNLLRTQMDALGREVSGRRGPTFTQWVSVLLDSWSVRHSTLGQWSHTLGTPVVLEYSAYPLGIL
jgi:hypothetical protein